MKIESFFIIGIILITAGCASVKESYAPDGRRAYALNCSGLARGWDKCYSAAGDICKDKGYDILDRSDENTVVAGMNNQGGFGTKSNERSMLVACKK